MTTYNNEFVEFVVLNFELSSLKKKKQRKYLFYSSLPTTIISMTKLLTYSITNIIIYQ